MWIPIPVAALWSFAAFLSPVEPQSQARDFAALASPSSVFAIWSDDVPALRTALVRNHWYRAFASPDSPLARMMELEASDLSEIATVLSPERTAEDLAALPEDPRKFAVTLDAIRGGAGIWIVLPDLGEGEPTFTVLLETRDRTADVVAQFAAWHAEDTDAEPTAEPFRGSHWVRFENEEWHKTVMFGALDGFTVIIDGNVEKAEAERAALHARVTTPGRRGGLHENQRHVEALRALSVPGQVSASIDLSVVMEMARQGLERTVSLSEDGAAIERAVDRTGIFKLGWAGLRFGIGAGERADFEFVLDVPPQTILAEVMDLMRPLPMGLLARVPKDAIAVQAANYDLAGFFELGMRVADDVYPGARQMAEMGMAMASAELGIDLREELVDLLSGEFVSFLTPRSFAGAKAPLAAFSAMESLGTMMLGSPDPEALASTLVDLVESAAMDMGDEAPSWEITEADGRELHVLRGLEAMLGADPRMMAGSGVLAIAVDGSDPGVLVGAAPEESVLDTALLGRQLRDVRQASYASAIHTAKTLASLFSTWADAFGDRAMARAELETYFGNHFSGTTVRTIERRPTFLRFYQGAQ